MVSRHNIVLVPEGIHHLLYSHKFVIGPKVGDIAAEVIRSNLEKAAAAA